ncbi:MAG: LuxR C-terminal-related transcriptional regulator [Rhodobacteraceae bacterium]|nr:LuxR C-terminal-related transcriptional regulator [Paracoccaceae bacterium]
MERLGNARRHLPGENGDLIRSLRESCGASCLMYGFFEATSREIIEMRLSSASDCPEEIAKSIVSAGIARASVLASLGMAPEPAMTLMSQSGQPDGFPVWCTDKNFVFGMGKPVGNYYPILTFCKRDTLISPEIRALLQFALAYINKSLTEYIYSKPIWPEGLAEATLKLLAIGYFVVKKNGEIEIDGREDVAQNCEFLTVTGNRLSTHGAKERAALADAIRLAAGDERQASVVSISDGHEQLKMVLIAPFEKGDKGRALVLFETHGTDHFALRDHFFRAHSITRSEAQVAHEVLNGRSTLEASEATGLSLETVRSYLKQVFYKTGTHRQSELISLYYSWTLPVGKSIAAAQLRSRH